MTNTFIYNTTDISVHLVCRSLLLLSYEQKRMTRIQIYGYMYVVYTQRSLLGSQSVKLVPQSLIHFLSCHHSEAFQPPRLCYPVSHMEWFRERFLKTTIIRKLVTSKNTSIFKEHTSCSTLMSRRFEWNRKKSKQIISSGNAEQILQGS